ncbi:hypothetical protein ACJX0J_012967, partial [Zea mays]
NGLPMKADNVFFITVTCLFGILQGLIAQAARELYEPRHKQKGSNPPSHLLSTVNGLPMQADVLFVVNATIALGYQFVGNKHTDAHFMKNNKEKQDVNSQDNQQHHQN